MSISIAILSFLFADTTPSGPWSQWGGPGRDFHAPPAKLAESWPAGGPKQLWSRQLGDGFSAVVTDGKTLYTMYRGDGNQNIAAAIDPANGKTLWERPLDATPLANMFLDYGKGPNSTPLIAGSRLFVATFTGQFAALDRNSGKMLWYKELWKELGGTFRDVGYSNSPIAVGDLVIAPVGGQGKGVIALRQSDGGVAWQKTNLANAMSSPILIQVDGKDQLVVFMVDGVAGLDPKTGDQLWLHPHKTDYDVNAATPVWYPEHKTLVISSAYSSGARAIQLTPQGPTELWFNRRLRVHHGNLLRIGDHVYASSGDFGPAPLTAVHIPTGKIAWQERKFSKANLIYCDGKVIVLDEDGNLALASLSPTGLKVISEAQPLTKLAWTPPTLAGTKLFIRDRKTLAAYELGR